ncbi:MAG TPA: hypothetical protein VLU96_04200 [Gaiellaceae bacterium]|nr:hypothetical protein [Gaiellaceae bacterium]
MPDSFAGRRGQAPVRYRIVIRGEISEPLVGPLEGMTVEAKDDESALTGDIVDQAQLHGALTMLTNLGHELVSVNALGDADSAATAGNSTVSS